jgi:hypothetical protein
MKSPRTLFAATTLLIAAAIMTACGASPSSHFVPHQPPPPPTGTNYTTCSGQQMPNWLSPLFQNNYQPAIRALVSNYESNSSVGYIRIGVGKGGEINLPQGWNDQNSGVCYGGYTGTWGYTVGGNSTNSSTWNNYLASMITFEHSLNSSKTLMISITPVTGAGTVTDDFIAPLAVAAGIGYGNQGLEASDITDYPNCGGDWCNLFGSSPPVIKELQTIGQSCPASTSCANSQAQSTGPLPPLLAFGTGIGGVGIPIVPHPANDFELYYQDWLIAYDPTYANSLGVSAADQAAYKAAIQAAAATGAKMQVLFPPQPGDTDFPAVQTYLMSNPDVTGAVISAEWSDFDLGNATTGAHTSYDFSITDGVIQPWIQAGKKVNLVLQDTTYGGSGNCPSSGIGSNGNTGNNCAMPAWMWTVLH